MRAARGRREQGWSCQRGWAQLTRGLRGELNPSGGAMLVTSLQSCTVVEQPLRSRPRSCRCRSAGPTGSSSSALPGSPTRRQSRSWPTSGVWRTCRREEEPGGGPARTKPCPRRLHPSRLSLPRPGGTGSRAATRVFPSAGEDSRGREVRWLLPVGPLSSPALPREVLHAWAEFWSVAVSQQDVIVSCQMLCPLRAVRKPLVS